MTETELVVTKRPAIRAWVFVLQLVVDCAGATAMFLIVMLWNIWAKGGVLSTTPPPDRRFPIELILASITVLAVTTVGVWTKLKRWQFVVLIVPHLVLLDAAAHGVVTPPRYGMAIRVAMNAYLAAPAFLMVAAQLLRWKKPPRWRRGVALVALFAAWVAIGGATYLWPRDATSEAPEPPSPRYSVPIRWPG